MKEPYMKGIAEPSWPRMKIGALDMGQEAGSGDGLFD